MPTPRTRIEAAAATALALSLSAGQMLAVFAAFVGRIGRGAWDGTRLQWRKRVSTFPLTGPQQGGGLFRKYAALLVALVGGALVVNAAIEMYYSYGESRQALVAVQREKAQGAAAVIEQFVKEIESQVGWATGFLPAGSGLEQRRFDFLRL